MKSIFLNYLNSMSSFFWITAIIMIITISIVVFSEAYGLNFVSTSFVKILGKTLCLCIVALAMDLVWGYCGILSLGHFAFFGLGGYMIGMWLMFERTKSIVIESTQNNILPLTHNEINEAIGTQIFGVVGGAEIPMIWIFADTLSIHLLLVLFVPGILAFIFGWLAFRSRVNGVYLSILTQAMTLGLSLYLFQNDSGLRGNNGLSGLQNIPNFDNITQAELSIWFLIASSLTLVVTYFICNLVVKSKLGNVIKGIRDNETRIRFLGYKVESYKLFVFVITAIISGIAGALYYPQAGIINPAELAPIASIYLAVWVAIGGRGSLYGAVIGAAFVSLSSSYFTGGQIPNIDFGIFTLKWVDWWVVILGLSFVITTLYAPKGIGGLAEIMFRKKQL
ncbi:urea ABC transporter permease subunit UrtC [Alphaproteobacteria bacterium]|nr:urea ABC transporter permease subunit UrtC [Alphaproteobacteria bacterium]